jgi:hypothetical protein
LTYKIFKGTSGFNIGKIDTLNELNIEDNILYDFESLINDTGFWEAKENSNERLGYDGSTWIIEGIKNKEYHYVNRWSPEENDPLYKIGEKMIEISRQKFDKIY